MQVREALWGGEERMEMGGIGLFVRLRHMKRSNWIRMDGHVKLFVVDVRRDRRRN